MAKKSSRRRRRWLIALVVTVASVLVVLAILWLFGPGETTEEDHVSHRSGMVFALERRAMYLVLQATVRLPVALVRASRPLRAPLQFAYVAMR
jgi:hypothetical protein